MISPASTSFGGVRFSNFVLSGHFFQINSRIFCFQETALSSQFVRTTLVKVCLLARADVSIFQMFIYHTDRAGIGFSLECSSLHGYIAAWQTPMASEPSSPPVETEKYQHCQERENKQLMKKKRNESEEVQETKTSLKPSGSFYHSRSLVLTPIKCFFKFPLKRKCVMLRVLCCSAAFFYRRCGNSWIACE